MFVLNFEYYMTDSLRIWDGFQASLWVLHYGGWIDLTVLNSFYGG
jgi:hypothetical protein